MKKIVALLIAMLVAALPLIGCAEGDGRFQWKKDTLDGAQVKVIQIDVRDRRIEVKPSADEQIHIGYAQSAKEYYDIALSEDHALTITAVTDKQWTDYFGHKAAAEDRLITLEIPAVGLEALTISTTNGDIVLSGVTAAGSLSLANNGGSIELDRAGAGEAILLMAKNGDIHGSVVGSYDDFSIACAIKKGDSNLPASKASGVKTLEATNNNGNIELDFVSE